MNETTQPAESDRFVIWSIEHDAWWRPGRWGYTKNLREAGRYTRSEAEEIVRQASIVHFRECMIPVAAIAWSDGE